MTETNATGGAAEPRLRPYRGPVDHPDMNRVANAVRAFNGDPSNSTVADIDNHYAHLENADLPRDCALVELDGRVVAYGRASRVELITGDQQVECIMNLEPEARGRGIEELLLGHALRRAEEIVAEFGRDRPIAVGAYVMARDDSQRVAVEAAGFSRIRSGVQLIRPNLEDIPDVPLPDGFEIRPIEASDRAMHRRVWEAAARAFANSYGEQAQTEDQYERWLSSNEFNPPLWRVAFHGDTIAAQILNFLGEAEPDGSRLGWTESISTQPEFRRNGLARALLAESLRAVRDAGATKAALGADSQNPNQAQSLYESMGFRVVATTYDYRLGPFPPGSKPQLVPEAWR
jgi:ribosomal protein S18 acetylase RimI-like enzyme